MNQLHYFVSQSVEVLSFLLILALGIGILAIFILYIIDRLQNESTLRKNYPVIARFRYGLEHLGEFLRQYMFAGDREELPFNRAERSWVYRAAKNVDSTVAFGSTNNLKTPGTVYFVNCPFPTLEEDAVEPGEVIVGPYAKTPYKTKSIFNISGMSYGALSIPAIKSLSHGAKLSGIWLNTGEGGLSPYHLEGGADLIFQIGTAKFGVRNKEGGLSEEKLKEVAAHPEVKMFELKLSQGAKPGKGGILPASKITPEIAKIRGIEMGKDAISPNRHPEINNVQNLLDMIQYIRETTGKPVGFKTVIGAYGWIESLCKEIDKRGIESAPDFITIDSADGGTGAAPMSLLDSMGIPIKESLPIVIDILEKYKLKDRIKVIASGKLIHPSEAVWALCAGADFVVSARGFMFALGCIQALKCNKNTCPTGITTHDHKLQYGLDPRNKAVRVANYANNLHHEIGIIAHSCGVTEPRRLKRIHARIVLADSTSISMDDLYK